MVFNVRQCSRVECFRLISGSMLLAKVIQLIPSISVILIILKNLRIQNRWYEQPNSRWGFLRIFYYEVVVFQLFISLHQDFAMVIGLLNNL